MKHILSIILLLLMAGVVQAAYVDCSGMPKSHTVTVDINLASDGSSVVAGGATTERAGDNDSNYYYNFTSEVAGTTYSIECVDATNSIYTYTYTLSGRDTYNDASVAAVKAKTDNLPTDPADDSDIDTQLVAIQADLDNPSQYKADVSALALNSTVAKEATLTNATYGLSALQVLLDAIATSTELTAMFDAIKGVGWTTETLKAIYDLGGGAGLTAQQVRDAMQLAPTTDSPATGSVDKKLDNIERHN